MPHEQFAIFVRKIMAQKPAWFENTEGAACQKDIAMVEAKLGCALPEQFKYFATTFGGGYFGGINVSTVDEKSEWHIISRPSVQVNDRAMLVISDDESGGYYGFLFHGKSYGETIFYVHPDDGSLVETAASSFFEFIENFALEF